MPRNFLIWLATLQTVWAMSAAPAEAAQIKVFTKKLSTDGSVLLNIAGTVNRGILGGDVSVDLPDGDYEVLLRGAQGSYGTFRIRGGVVTETTGALVGSADVLDFNLPALAPVHFLGDSLTVPAGLMMLQIAESAGTFFRPTTVYLPPSRPGTQFEVMPRGAQGAFGAFIVTPTLEISMVPSKVANAASALYLDAEGRIAFDLTKLGRVELLGADTSVPAGRTTLAIAESVGSFYGSATLYLPPNTPGGQYEVTPRGAHGSYGAFVVTPEASIAAVGSRFPNAANALIIDASGRVGFDTQRLGHVHVLGSRLSSPASALVALGVANVAGTFWGDFTVYLPPNATESGSYLLTLRAGYPLGAFRVAPNLSIHTDPAAGALRQTGEGLDIEPCVLHSLTVRPTSPHRLLVNEAIGWIGAPYTFSLPGGSYTATFSTGATASFSLAGTDSVLPEHPELAQFTLEPTTCDADADGVGNESDNCPTELNSDQLDQDVDGVGNACDPDLDGDGVANASDNCPDVANLAQTDLDADNLGDACDNDQDGDLVNDISDNCLGLANTDQADSDADLTGDACDWDDDDDGVSDGVDNCPMYANPTQTDFDSDGGGDACDGDQDNDGVTNVVDLCAQSPAGLPHDPEGCTGAQRVERLCPPSTAATHGQYVSCVARVTSEAVQLGLLSEGERARFVAAAARAK